MNGRPKLLIVEDDPGLQSQMRWCFDAYDVGVVDTREMAIAEIRRREPPVVILDLGLPPDAEGTTEGVAALDEILSLAPYTKVIVVTGNDDKQNSVKSIGLGAYDFYQKPIDPDLLNLVVQRAGRAALILNKYPYNNGHCMVIPRRHLVEPDHFFEQELHVAERSGVGNHGPYPRIVLPGH